MSEHSGRIGGTATASSPLAALDEALGRRVSMRALALLRVLVGPVVLLHLRPFLADGAAGRIYRDTFHEPYAAWYPELPRASTSPCCGWVRPPRWP